MVSTGLGELVTLHGPLAFTVPQLYPGTAQYAAQLTAARKTSPELRDEWFWAGDFAMYRMEEKKPSLPFPYPFPGAKAFMRYLRKDYGRKEAVLYLSKYNPVLNNPDNIGDAVNQLLSTRNFVPSQDDIQRVIDSVKSGEGIRVRLSELELKVEMPSYIIREDPKGEGVKLSEVSGCIGVPFVLNIPSPQITIPRNSRAYFKIDTGNYDQLNPEQRKVAEWAFGQGEAFTQAMEMLRQSGIKATEVPVLNPYYVEDMVIGDGAIGRLCRLLGFDVNSMFSAIGYIVDTHDEAIRGKVKEARETEHDLMIEALQTILSDPERAVNRITPRIHDKLSELLEKRSSSWGL